MPDRSAIEKMVSRSEYVSSKFGARKCPYGSIDGQDYAIWTYKLAADAPLAFAHQVGLGFPADVALKDPADYPDIGALKGVALEPRATPNDRQRLFVTAPAGAPQHELAISVLAPSAESSKTLLTVDTKLATEDRWTNLPFNAASGTDNAVAMRGPAAAASTASTSAPSPAPPTSLRGTLPYASELFGAHALSDGFVCTCGRRWFRRSFVSPASARTRYIVRMEAR